MKVLFCFWLFIVVVSASLLKKQDVQFEAFKLKYGKTYKSQIEETIRFNIFKGNLNLIEQHNALFERGLITYRKGINKFTDMTQEELRALLLPNPPQRSHLNVQQHVKTDFALPESVDWRKDGQVTAVRDQGWCGSCWAMSVTGATEAAYKRKSGKLVTLSPQQLTDCTTDINFGCEGGYLNTTFPYIIQNGIQSEESYPYYSGDTALAGSCKYSAADVVTKISGYKAIGFQDEDGILDAVAHVGPVSALLDASLLYDYKSGIYVDERCSKEYSHLSHAVLIVGYGTENGTDYWLVKNSYGRLFGEDGYFRIRRGTNECGIADDGEYPIIN